MCRSDNHFERVEQMRQLSDHAMHNLSGDTRLHISEIAFSGKKEAVGSIHRERAERQLNEQSQYWLTYRILHWVMGRGVETGLWPIAKTLSWVDNFEAKSCACGCDAVGALLISGAYFCATPIIILLSLYLLVLYPFVIFGKWMCGRNEEDVVVAAAAAAQPIVPAVAVGAGGGGGGGAEAPLLGGARPEMIDLPRTASAFAWQWLLAVVQLFIFSCLVWAVTPLDFTDFWSQTTADEYSTFFVYGLGCISCASVKMMQGSTHATSIGIEPVCTTVSSVGVAVSSRLVSISHSPQSIDSFLVCLVVWCRHQSRLKQCSNRFAFTSRPVRVIKHKPRLC